MLAAFLPKGKQESPVRDSARSVEIPGFCICFYRGVSNGTSVFCRPDGVSTPFIEVKGSVCHTLALFPLVVNFVCASVGPIGQPLCPVQGRQMGSKCCGPVSSPHQLGGSGPAL